MKRAVRYVLLAALISGCGRDEPAKPEVAAPPPPPPAPEAPAPAVTPSEPPPSAQPTKPKADTARPGTRTAKAGAPGERVYTVRRGDTLQAIAKKHGVNYRDLARWNDIRDPGRIRVGQKLRLTPPGK
jgi:nucleoid-associated protein YgaU